MLQLTSSSNRWLVTWLTNLLLANHIGISRDVNPPGRQPRLFFLSSYNFLIYHIAQRQLALPHIILTYFWWIGTWSQTLLTVLNVRSCATTKIKLHVTVESLYPYNVHVIKRCWNSSLQQLMPYFSIYGCLFTLQHKSTHGTFAFYMELLQVVFLRSKVFCELSVSENMRADNPQFMYWYTVRVLG